MTYRFLHRFKDGTLGMGRMNYLPQITIKDDIHFDIQVPENKPKRWHNEFLRWMNEVIIPKSEELQNQITVEFKFL